MATGIDIVKVTESEQLDELRKVLADHLVVFLPDQHMDLDDLERITDLLGGRDTTPFVTPLQDRPYVIRVIKEPEDQLNFANAWHSDLSYLPEPPSYTLLHAAEAPDFGGDTLWSNQYLAYETLSRGLKETLDGLRAVHSAGMAYGTGGFLDQVKDLTSMAIAPSADAYKERSHPVVIEHPVTKRAALTGLMTIVKVLVGPTTSVLQDHQPACGHRHNLSPGDKRRWDSRALASATDAP